MSGKKRNVMLFVLLFTLLLGVIVPVQAQSYGGTKTIRVAYREDADFINKSSSGVYKGYGVEYLNKISQYTGWRYEYINESWENQLVDLKSGKVDLICNAQKTEAREKDYDFSCMPVGTVPPWYLRPPSAHGGRWHFPADRYRRPRPCRSPKRR